MSNINNTKEQYELNRELAQMLPSRQKPQRQQEHVRLWH